jgi:ribosomal protein L37AE/L43A
LLGEAKTARLRFVAVGFLLRHAKYSMIRLCPFCGHTLGRKLTDGITTCSGCQRVFETSKYHRLLSAGWVVRKWHVEDVDTLIHKFDFTEEEAEIVYKYVVDGCMSHDEFLKVLDDLDLK